MQRVLLACALITAVASSAHADHDCDVKIKKGIVLHASFAYDRGCMFQSLQVNGKKYDDIDKATPKAMAALGWKKAKDAKKRELAMMWVDDVLARVGEYRVVQSADKPEFGKLFYEPKTESKDGAVTITYWRDDTIIGMRQPEFRSYVETEVTIDAKGALTVNDLQSYKEPF